MSFASAKASQRLSWFGLMQAFVLVKDLKEHCLWIDQRCFSWISADDLPFDGGAIVDAKKLEEIRGNPHFGGSALKRCI